MNNTSGPQVEAESSIQAKLEELFICEVGYQDEAATTIAANAY